MLECRYPKNMYGKKIGIIGVFPPPYGGISVHIERVIQQFKKQHNQVYFFSVTPRIRTIRFCYIGHVSYALYLLFWLFLTRPEYVYFHTLFLSTSLAELRMLLFFKKVFGSRLILVEHNNRFLEMKSRRYKNRLSTLLQKVDKQIFIGNTKQYYEKHAVAHAPEFSVESPFVPPDTTQEDRLLAYYPHSLFRFLKMHRPIIVVNASQQTFIQGRHLYGFDICIEVLVRLRATFPTIGVIFVSNFKATHWRAYAQSFNGQEHCYFLEGTYQLWPLLKRADLFVRPNLDDTYGISVAEALFVGTPAIASAVCTRPKGTILFDIDNKDELFEKIVKELKKNEFNKQSDYLHSEPAQRHPRCNRINKKTNAPT